MNKDLVTIVIPVYKADLSASEMRSLKQCVKILGQYNIVFIQPESLDASAINFEGKILSEKFPDHYFKSVLGYNSLMLSAGFYERFLESKYMLIYQLDAFVFKDELIEWCNKGYDYIGAPWVSSPNTLLKRFLSIFDSKKKKERSQIFFKVGNGGFSLRNNEKCFTIAKAMKNEIAINLKRKATDFYIMEDVFWSITVPKSYPDFNIPAYKEALGFAIDRKPEIALELHKGKLPFGCHGFDKPKVKDFWNTILEEQSSKI